MNWVRISFNENWEKYIKVLRNEDMSKDLDIVVFGASGYTGKLVVEYLKNEYGENGSLKWAIAGRDETKLTAVKEEFSLGNDLETVIVESDDLDSLDLSLIHI